MGDDEKGLAMFTIQNIRHGFCFHCRSDGGRRKTGVSVLWHEKVLGQAVKYSSPEDDGKQYATEYFRFPNARVEEKLEFFCFRCLTRFLQNVGSDWVWHSLIHFGHQQWQEQLNTGEEEVE